VICFHLMAPLYATRIGVNVPPHEYMGPLPPGSSTLTPIRSAEEPPAMRWNGLTCECRKENWRKQEAAQKPKRQFIKHAGAVCGV